MSKTTLQPVAATDGARNDPGSSQDGGLAYERLDPPSHEEENSEQTLSEAAEAKTVESKKPNLRLIKNEPMGMAAVVTDLLNKLSKSKRPKGESSTEEKVGLTIKYSNDGSSAKGMLLNKKAE